MKSIKEMTPYEKYVLNRNIASLEESIKRVKECVSRGDAISLNLTLNKIEFHIRDARQAMEIY